MMPLNKIDQARFQRLLAIDLNSWKTEPAELDFKSGGSNPQYRQAMRVLPHLLAEGDLKMHHLLVGPRQSGKTTILWQTIKELKNSYGIPDNRIFYLEMDHPELKHENLGAVVEVLLEIVPNSSRHNPVFLLVDEICRSADWGGWVKMFSDNGKPVRILATSSAFTWNTDKPDSLVGRLSIHNLMPCNFLEYVEFRGSGHQIPECFRVAYPSLKERLEDIPRGIQLPAVFNAYLRQMLLLGSYPECARQFTCDTQEGEYLQTIASHPYLRRVAQLVVAHDVPLIEAVRNSAQMLDLLHSCAVNLSRSTDLSKIGKAAGFQSGKTTAKYVDLLEKAFLLSRIRAHIELDPDEDSDSAPVIPRQQKVLFRDTAMAGALKQGGTASLDDDRQKGWTYENAVGAALLELSENSGCSLSYWHGGRKEREVDFIYDGYGMNGLAVEVGSSASHHHKGLASLRMTLPRFKDGTYMVALDSAVLHPKRAPSGIGEMPIAVFLLAVGAQSLQESFAKGGLTATYNYRVKQPVNNLLFLPPSMPQTNFSNGSIVSLLPHEAKTATQNKTIDPRRIVPDNGTL